jgi:hypothetical protein
MMFHVALEQAEHQRATAIVFRRPAARSDANARHRAVSHAAACDRDAPAACESGATAHLSRVTVLFHNVTKRRPGHPSGRRAGTHPEPARALFPIAVAGAPAG